MASKTQNKTKKTSVKTAQKSSDIPEFIEGIPTKKDCKNKRLTLINKYYEDLLGNLQRIRKGKKESNYIVNRHLRRKIYILGQSVKKARSNSVNKWQSTYAVKHLYEVIENSEPIPGTKREYSDPKSKTQISNGYKKILTLYYQFKNIDKKYMNFWVKLTIGIFEEKKHIQYAVNKIDIKK